MKVLLVHDFYQQHGGEDVNAEAERALLEANGHEVILYTRHNAEIAGYDFLGKLTLPFHAIYSMRTHDEITALVRKHRPQVAYVHNFFPLISPSLYHTLHSLRVPSVQLVNDFRFLCPNGWFYVNGRICERCKHGNYAHAVLNRCYRDSYLQSAAAASVMAVNRLAGGLNKIDAYVCVSEFVKRNFQDAGLPDARLFVKPNFLDASKIVPHFVPGNYALYLGRLSHEKGIRTLLDAFEQVPAVPLKIVGTGPCEEEVRARLSRNGLRHVQFVGFKSGHEKWELLRNAAFVIVPSVWYEACPNVVLEAYAAGKPVIASRIGALQEMVEHDHTGLLFASAAAAELAAAVRFLAANPEHTQRFGHNGRKLVETKFGPELNFATLSRIFSDVTRSSLPALNRAA